MRMTAYFLAATGQRRGREGASRWVVLECACELCAGGRHCAVDEPNEYACVDMSKWRHIAIANLEVVGTLPKAADLPEELSGDVLTPLVKRKKRKAA